MKNCLACVLLVWFVAGCGLFKSNSGSDEDKNSDALPVSLLGRYSGAPMTIGHCHGGVLVVYIKENNHCEFQWHNITCNPSYFGKGCTMNLPQRTFVFQSDAMGYKESFKFSIGEETITLSNGVVLKKDKPEAEQPE